MTDDNLGGDTFTFLIWGDELQLTGSGEMGNMEACSCLACELHGTFRRLITGFLTSYLWMINHVGVISIQVLIAADRKSVV